MVRWVTSKPYQVNHSVKTKYLIVFRLVKVHCSKVTQIRTFNKLFINFLRLKILMKLTLNVKWWILWVFNGFLSYSTLRFVCLVREDGRCLMKMFLSNLFLQNNSDPGIKVKIKFPWFWLPRVISIRFYFPLA